MRIIHEAEFAAVRPQPAAGLRCPDARTQPVARSDAPASQPAGGEQRPRPPARTARPAAVPAHRQGPGTHRRRPRPVRAGAPGPAFAAGRAGLPGKLRSAHCADLSPDDERLCPVAPAAWPGDPLEDPGPAGDAGGTSRRRRLDPGTTGQRRTGPGDRLPVLRRARAGLPAGRRGTPGGDRSAGPSGLPRRPRPRGLRGRAARRGSVAAVRWRSSSARPGYSARCNCWCLTT